MATLDFLFLFFILTVTGFLLYSLYRLYRTRVTYNLILVTLQMTAVIIALLAAREGIYDDAFIICLVILLGVLIPLGLLFIDYYKLRQVLKEKTQLTISHLIYKNYARSIQEQQEEVNRADVFIKPIAGDFPIENIVDEIRVERSDTTRNILRQLESAHKKRQESDLEGAYEVYSLIETIFNRSPSLYFNMGNIKYLCGEYEEAVKNYKRSLDCAGNKEFEGTFDNEKTGLFYYNLGNTYFMQKKYGKATEAYKAAVDIIPTKDEIYFNLSLCHAVDFQETGDTEKAVDAFQKIIEDMPENLFAWYNFGKCMYQTGNITQAIECFQKVVNEDAAFHECWYSLAMAYDEIGQAADAIKAYYTAIEIKPDFIDAYNNLGVLLSAVGRYIEALKVLRSAAKIKPDDNELKFNIGLTLYESKKYDEALAELLPVVEQRPNDDALLYTIALAFLNLDKEYEALEYLSFAVQSNPKIKERAINDEKFRRLLYSNEAYREIVS